jgi:hypothetical protein
MSGMSSQDTLVLETAKLAGVFQLDGVSSDNPRLSCLIFCLIKVETGSVGTLQSNWTLAYSGIGNDTSTRAYTGS